MPNYDYRCLACNELFEVARSYKERETDVACPTCKYPATRVYSSPAVKFKGVGWGGDK